MRINQITEGSRYKCTCHPGDADPDCPVHGLEPMEVGDALDVKPGVAEGSGKNVVKSVKVGNFRHDLVDTGMGWQVRIYNGDELYDTGLSKNSEQKGLAALEDAVAYTEKQTNTRRQGVAEGRYPTDDWKQISEIESTTGKVLGLVLQHLNGTYGFYDVRKSNIESGFSSPEEARQAFVELHNARRGVAEGSTGVSVRKWANQVRKDHGADVKFWNRKEGGGAVDSVIARNSQGETVGVYNRKTGYPTVYEPKQGVAEGDLNEKSTSQAQFRTMAAAAHNPKFAKKVGIKQSVAREFNKADTGQDYKSLPKRATEGATVTTTPGSIEPGGAVDNFKQQMANNTERDMAEGNRKPEPPEADYGPAYQDMVQRVKKLAGLGPLKTVYDPARRVYRNMPTAVQPKK